MLAQAAAIVAAAGCLLAMPHAFGGTATINVTPTQLVLPRPGATTSLMLRNESDEPARFQVTGHRWSNTSDGQIALEPTSDLIFFPTVFTLEPRQTRRLRIACKLAASARELTYRLILEQLPALQRPPDGGVQMLMRASVPVFVQPSTLIAKATLAPASFARDEVQVDLRNHGTVHVRVQEIVVRAEDAAGAVLHEARVAGWYVLPEETRRFRVPMPSAICERVRAIGVTATFASGFDKPLVERTPTPAGACGG